jgi:tol-pal system protein YbgF
LLLLTAVSVVGCATQADLSDVRKEQRSIRSQLADTRATVDGMQRDLAAMRGKVQETRHAERAQGRMENLEARLAAIEQSRGGAPLEGATPVPMASPAPEMMRAEPPPEHDDSADTPEAYRRALAAVRQREYDRAIQQFREFLRTNPDSPLAGNAHYWIGESYYTLGDYSQAILQFNEVRQHYPKSDRAAAALLKIGLAFLQMGNKSEARLAFQKVVNDYPASPEAGQAREKLRTLGA